MPSNITFRRIGGRIVPIKMSPQAKRDTAKGAALVGGGLAVAHATGHATAAAIEKTAKAEFKARGLGPLFEHNAAFKANLAEKQIFRIRNVGTVASAALIGAGVNTVLNHTRLKNDEKTKGAIGAGAGVAATFTVRSAYLRRVGIRGVEVIKQAAKRALKAKL